MVAPFGKELYNGINARNWKRVDGYLEETCSAVDSSDGQLDLEEALRCFPVPGQDANGQELKADDAFTSAHLTALDSQYTQNSAIEEFSLLHGREKRLLFTHLRERFFADVDAAAKEEARQSKAQDQEALQGQQKEPEVFDPKDDVLFVNDLLMTDREERVEYAYQMAASLSLDETETNILVEKFSAMDLKQQVSWILEYERTLLMRHQGVALLSFGQKMRDARLLPQVVSQSQ